MTGRVELLSLSVEQLEEQMRAWGQPKFRAGQLYRWLVKGAELDEMSNLPAAFRAQLRECAQLNPVRIREALASQLDGTEKFLYELGDGNLIEGVLMRYHHGNTLCLSTQVGCRMGCAFCASTLEGCVRNLTPGEMLGQVVAVNRRLEAQQPGQRVGNVVLMGSGEPLDNYDSTVKFLRLLNDPRGLHLSLRGVSLSTCGLVPRIYQLAGEGLPVTLSLSLHAPNDEIRRRILPVAKVYSMEEVLKACRAYIEKTGRRVIFEYALIEGVNAELRHADELAAQLRGMQCHVNLIPLNDVPERQLHPPSARQVNAFLERLAALNVSATKRREMGDDIQGACGQLRRHALREGKAQQDRTGQ